jgi:hypothetical protein
MRFMISGVLIALLSPVPFARPYYMSKVELVKKAQVIAILRISHVEQVEVAGSDHVYSQSALATVERVIKGSISGSVTLYAQQTSEARVDFAPGRYLVFLSRDGDLLVGTNWHLSVRPINKENVEWYASNKGYALKTTQLSVVLKEIESIVRKSSGSQKPIVNLDNHLERWGRLK